MITFAPFSRWCGVYVDEQPSGFLRDGVLHLAKTAPAWLRTLRDRYVWATNDEARMAITVHAPVARQATLAV